MIRSNYIWETSETPYIEKGIKLRCRQPEELDECAQLLLERPNSAAFPCAETV